MRCVDIGKGAIQTHLSFQDIHKSLSKSQPQSAGICRGLSAGDRELTPSLQELTDNKLLVTCSS